MADDVRYLAPSDPGAAPRSYDAVALHRRVAALLSAGVGALPSSPWRHVGLIALRSTPGGALVEARSSVVLWCHPADGGGERAALRRRDLWRPSAQGWRLVRRAVNVGACTVPAWACSLLW